MLPADTAVGQRDKRAGLRRLGMSVAPVHGAGHGNGGHPGCPPWKC